MVHESQAVDQSISFEITLLCSDNAFMGNVADAPYQNRTLHFGLRQLSCKLRRIANYEDIVGRAPWVLCRSEHGDREFGFGDPGVRHAGL